MPKGIPTFYSKNFGKYRENVGINRFCMYVEGNEDDHSHQPYAEADKRVRSEAGQIQAVRSESHRIRPVGRQPCRIHRCEAASRPFLGRGRIQTGFAPAKERNTMSNILTDNTRTRRLAASVLAGVVLLGGMAGLSGTAMAAGAGTITLTARPTRPSPTTPSPPTRSATTRATRTPTPTGRSTART